jgi:hypothetical protein
MVDCSLKKPGNARSLFARNALTSKEGESVQDPYQEALGERLIHRDKLGAITTTKGGLTLVFMGAERTDLVGARFA